MKIFSKIILSLGLAAVVAAPAGAVIDNPITKAVIAVYDQQLRANPQDYLTWFRRANEYYRHNEYVRALEDVNNALANAPSNDKDLRFQAYMLRACIYDQTNKHELALADLNSACSLDPTSIAAIYMKANTEFELGNFSAARDGYERIRRMNPRSIESYIGMARCAVKENNLGTAAELLQQAVDLTPNNPEVYVRRASVRKMMGDHNGAVEDLIVALSLDSKDPKAVQALVDYGNTNYPATVAGLTNAIQLAPSNALYRYLRASIAEAHYNYVAAIDDYQKIIDDRLYNYHGINASLARCLYGLGRYEEALAQVDAAMAESTNVSDYYVLRSKILRALKRPDQAIETAAAGLAVDRESVDALCEMALNYIDKGNYTEANGLLGEASMADANDPRPLLLRAWLLKNYLNQPVAADGFSQQALDIEGYDGNVRSMRGFALLNLGRTDEADAWMEQMLALPDNDGLINYYGACYYSMRDDTDKALSCAENSLKTGYSDLNDWMYNTDGPVNLGYLRDDLRFLQLLQRYTAIFGK